MRRKRWTVLAAALAVLSVFPGARLGRAEDGVPRMTKEELKGLLGRPDTVVLDVRHNRGIAPARIAGAIHEDPDRVEAWAGKYPREKRFVLYCS